MKFIHRLAYYVRLYLLYIRRELLGLKPPTNYVFDIKTKYRVERALSSSQKIFFYVPSLTAGAEFIILDLISPLKSYFLRTGRDFELVLVSKPPVCKQGDVLVSFKSTHTKILSSPATKILVLCDEAEKHWAHVGRFDAVVTTSSPEFFELVKTRNRNTVFIPEFETDEILEMGSQVLEKKDFRGVNSIGWHGGDYSKNALLSKVDLLSAFAKGSGASEVLLLGGKSPRRIETVRGLRLVHIPWGPDGLIEYSQKVRLAFLPARDSVRNSFLKPAARLRKSYALGVPAIGDNSVPEVRRLHKSLGLNFSRNAAADLLNLKNFWCPSNAKALAIEGWNFVRKKHSQDTAAESWGELLDQLLANQANGEGAVS